MSEKILTTIEKIKPKNFGKKDWKMQPDFFKHIIDSVDVSNSENELFLEFGVFRGTTFNIIRNVLDKNIKLFGFDAFYKGLPTDWITSTGRLLKPKGEFSQTQIPNLPENCEYIDGFVEDTLVPFLETHSGKIRFVHLDMDLYESTKYALNAIKHRFTEGTIIVVDDFTNFPGWEEFSFKAFTEIFESISDQFKVVPIATIGYDDSEGWSSVAFKLEKIKKYTKVVSKKNVTIVTGLWDLGRSELQGWAHRDFETYKQNFFKMLEADVQMCIWIPSYLEEEVWKIRSKENTRVYIKETEDFKTWFPFFKEHETIRNNPYWYNLAGWLKESPQAALPMYNPMMMSKVFMVNDSAIHNPFNSDYFYWIDGGLTNTVDKSYFLDGNVFSNIAEVYDESIVHISYPYQADKEIHGFEKNKFYDYCKVSSQEPTILISRGGFWGGPKELIHQYNVLYYSLLNGTILSGYVGADECLFTILSYLYPHLIQRFEIESNGLVWPFFDKMMDVEKILDIKNKKIKENRTNLYVLGFNSPLQFETLCKSLEEADANFLKKTKKILINNSTDETTFEKYDSLCEKYGFEEIHKDNLGVCGGRQFAAEHFEESGAKYYMFFEDDMSLNPSTERTQTCKSGFTKYIPDLYNKIHNIMNQSDLDFLKISFSEFYGDNSTQWAWYNVPQNIRSEVWPEYDKLPETGTDPNCPKTDFKNIYIIDGVSYITGDVYYSNWPQIVSRNGNKKMFLTTKWQQPYEQTWMSYMYQLSINNQLKGSVLLASPVTHNRFEFYKGELRKES